MQIDNLLTDSTLLQELGSRLAQLRIDRNVTQAQLANRAGIGKRTLERLESGGSVQLVTLIRLLRELNLLQNLETLIPKAGPGPLDYLERDGKTRQRASALFLEEGRSAPWRWGDEK